MKLKDLQCGRIFRFANSDSIYYKSCIRNHDGDFMILTDGWQGDLEDFGDVDWFTQCMEVVDMGEFKFSFAKKV